MRDAIERAWLERPENRPFAFETTIAVGVRRGKRELIRQLQKFLAAVDGGI